LTLPNLITIGRLLLVPLIIWLITAAQPGAAFAVLIVAGVSDAVDGFLARQFDLRSDLGTYLDPVADKAMLVSIYVTLATVAAIPIWLAILTVSRDVLIVGAVVLSWMLGVPTSVKPLRVSKVNTVAQIILAAVVLGDLAFNIDLGIEREFLVYVVALLTVASAAIYLVDWVRHMGSTEAASIDTSSGARDGNS
jgi:cardiolipin synthase